MLGSEHLLTVETFHALARCYQEQGHRPQSSVPGWQEQTYQPTPLSVHLQPLTEMPDGRGVSLPQTLATLRCSVLSQIISPNTSLMFCLRIVAGRYTVVFSLHHACGLLAVKLAGLCAGVGS
jgi:hypothetical protein